MHLSPTEARVLGALVEKQISTPDYYPLSLNAIVNACNQKNHRDPVTALDESTVLRAIESLRLKGLAYVFAGAAERVRKYGHNFAKALALDPAETAVLCVLLLRGPQTPGELRSRTPHLHNFETLVPVEETLARLTDRPPNADGQPQEPLVRKLPRLPGTKESRYTHLLGGEPAAENASVEQSAQNSPAAEISPQDDSRSEVSSVEGTTSLDQLRAEIAHLKSQLADLQTQFATFRKQFE